MGSLVIKIDKPTSAKLKNKHHYSDIDLFQIRNRSDGDIPIVYDVEAVKQSIRNILMWRVGESILHPEFGHNIQKSLYSQMNQFNQEEICQEIKRAIEDNEPRVEIKTVAAKVTEDDTEENRLNIKVVYVVKGDKTSDVEFEEQTTIEGK